MANSEKSLKGILEKQNLDSLRRIEASFRADAVMQADQAETLKRIETLSQEDRVIQAAQVVEEKRSQDDEEQSLKVITEQVKVSKEIATNIKKLGEDLKKQAAEDAKIITTIAGDMRLFKSTKENLGDKLKNSFGSLSKTLDSLGIIKKGSGGIISNLIEKREEKKNYIKDQKMLGSKLSDEELGKNFAKAQKAAKEINSNEQAINRFKKMGLNEAQLAKTDEGKKLLANRETLASNYAQFDLKTKFMSENNNLSEQDVEAQRTAEETKNLLGKIVENTSGQKDGAKAIKPEKAGEGEGKGGFLDTIMAFFSEGFMKALTKIFNPANILKSLGKVFAITMVIGSLVNGIMDGFEEFTKSGDIGKALIAGLGGVLSFLTFGLVDKEDVAKIVESVGDFVKKNIVEPLGAFFKNIKDGILNLISNIGIPEIKFKIPVINKDVSIGPYYPFKDMAPTAKPVAPEPTAANQVEAKSAENADAAVQSPASGNNTAVIAPTVNNVTKQNQIIKTPVRNQDSSINKYVNSRFA